MKIIYHCYGGSHSSVIAAALHLGWLSKNQVPSFQEMLSLPYFDKTTNNDFGTIRYMGVDEYGNEVYVLGKKGMGDRCTQILNGVAHLLGKEQDILAVNCMNRVNWLMKLGGFASRRMGLVGMGRPVLNIGTRKAFMNLVNLVEITRFKTMANGRVGK